MFGDKLTPEEKLLKIIETSPPAKRINLSLRKYQFFNSVRNNFIRILKEKKFLELKNITIFLGIVGFFLTVFSVWDFFHIQEELNKRLKEIKRIKPFKPKELPESESLSNIEFREVISEVRKRNIFSLSLLEHKSIKEADVEFELQVSDLKLVGVIWSENPQVMIEDTKSKKTYLLNTGDLIGNVKVKKIQRESVILEAEGQEWILR